MAGSTSLPRIRLYFLVTVLACLIGFWWYQRGTYWLLNHFADRAHSQGASIEGESIPKTEFEWALEHFTGLRYPERLRKIYAVDMLTARDIDRLMSRIEVAEDVSVVKLGPDLRSTGSLEPLGRLVHLTDVIIVADNADDRWLEAAVRAPKLRRVSVRGGAITDAGARTLAGARSLRILRIPDSQVTDAGVAALAGSTELVELDLRGSAITDASVPVLAALPNLNVLNAVRTRVSKTGVETLRAAGVRRVRW